MIREWVQNKDELCEEGTRWLWNAESRIVEVHGAWEKLDRPLASAAPNYDIPDLVQELANLARSLLRGSAVLKEDAECVMRALQRVKRKKRPSHERTIKESIHLENYLTLSRRPRETGYKEPVMFVSSNSSDYWQDRGKPERAHDDLVEDLSGANLDFFGNLPLALRNIGFLGAAQPA